MSSMIIKTVRMYRIDCDITGGRRVRHKSTIYMEYISYDRIFGHRSSRVLYCSVTYRWSRVM